MNSLGERVKSLRENMKLTQQDLGDIVELHGSNIGRIEKGKVFPASDVLLKMAIYFGVSCDWLLTGENAHVQNCENADEANLIYLYRKLSEKDKIDIQDMIEFKIYKAEKKKGTPQITSSHTTSTADNNMVG